jgi:hypothetical protein
MRNDVKASDTRTSFGRKNLDKVSSGIRRTLTKALDLVFFVGHDYGVCERVSHSEVKFT